MSAPERPPRAVVAEMLQGAWVCQAISTATALDVPDLVHRHGPLTASALVGEHGVEARPDLLERVLRALASLGIFTEDAEGRFGPTPLSEVLTLESPSSMKRFAELYGGPWWRSFGGLPEALRTGRPQDREVGADEPWRSGDPERAERFGEAMKSGSAPLVRGLLERADLSRARALVDVGGGFGHVAIGLLERLPELRACVLDRPEVIAIAERRAAREDAGVRARLSFAAGDMFAEVPPGDTYLLSRILHDWDDERCARVLRNCRERLPRGGRVLCVDAVLPPLGDTSGSGPKLLDLLMLVSLPGKERTEAEWLALLARADLEVASLAVLDPRSLTSLVVGIAPP